MRTVTLGTALVLSLVALSGHGSASATPVNKEPFAIKDGSAAETPAKKERVAKQPAVKLLAVKQPVAKQAVAKQAVAKSKSLASATPALKAATPKQSAKLDAAHQIKQQSASAQQVKKQPIAQQARAAAGSADLKKVAVAKHLSAPAKIAAEPAQPKVHRVRLASIEQTPEPTRVRYPALFASSDIVVEARRWIGTNPTNRDSLWCARFMNFVLERAGFQGTGSDAAKSFAHYGRRVSGPRIGAIAVMTRGKFGGHVGVVSGIDKSGNPIVISGNHGKKVGEGVYPRSRVYAYVMPL